jgi:hypothetical protein
MNKNKLIGICSTCLLIKGISELRFRHYTDLSEASISLAIFALTVVAAYAVFKEKKWGFTLALVIMSFFSISLIGIEIMGLISEHVDTFIILILPHDTALTIIGLISSLSLYRKSKT